jgi:hypothetical protein
MDEGLRTIFETNRSTKLKKWLNNRVVLKVMNGGASMAIGK